MLRRTVMSSLWLGLWLWSSVVLAQFSTLSGAWPQFRGPLRDAVSSDTGLLTEWPAGGPPLVWQTRGAGRGYSSVAIVGDRLYTLGDGLSIADDQDEYVVCFALADGAVVWKTGWVRLGPGDVPTGRVRVRPDGGRRPAVHPDAARRRGLPGNGDGPRALAQKHGQGFPRPEGRQLGLQRVGVDRWPTVDLHAGWRGGDDGRPGQDDGRRDLEEFPAGDRGAGHASAVISEVGGTRVYVNTTAGGALGVRAQDGRLLWSFDIDRTTAVIPTPIIRGDLVFFTAGYRRGGALLRQIPRANGLGRGRNRVSVEHRAGEQARRRGAGG
jgi:outer membrane protein assembly factor BamB